jgi:hypothetical protein
MFAPEFARRRRAVILATPELQERELMKLASLTDALADALRRRGVSDSAARLAGETGMAVFRITFERWATDPAGRSWPDHLHDALAELDELVLASPQPAA